MGSIGIIFSYSLLRTSKYSSPLALELGLIEALTKGQLRGNIWGSSINHGPGDQQCGGLCGVHHNGT